MRRTRCNNLLPCRGIDRSRDDANLFSHSSGRDRAFGSDAQVLLHNITGPVWGNERVQRSATQRDLYKYVHDQRTSEDDQGRGPPRNC